jgi:hypothetical protein
MARASDTYSPSMTLHYGAMDVGNNGMGVCDSVVGVRNSGLGVYDVVMNIRNNHMCVY